jgi:flagellar hook-associated protein FlgK
MVGFIQASTGAIGNYGKEMASVSDRISRAFREDSDVSIEREVAKSALIEHGLNANIKVIQAQDEMLGSILNIIA